MIKFNELRIENCNNTLIIDASVRDLSYYNDIYIDSITIDTQATYVGSGPSSNAIFTYNVPIGQSLKNIRLDLNATVLGVNFDTNLLFIYVSARGIPQIDVPCDMDNVHTLSVITNLYLIYRNGLKLLSEAQDDCQNSSKSLVDFILKLNAFDLAIKTCNYVTAIRYWNKYFKSDKYQSLTNNCGCNG